MIRHCIHCGQSFELQRDGYDDWRERCALAGVPIPSRDVMSNLAVAQALLGTDGIGSYIHLQRLSQNNQEKAECKRQPAEAR